MDPLASLVTCLTPSCVESMKYNLDTDLMIRNFRTLFEGAAIMYEDGLISCKTGPAIIKGNRTLWLYKGKLHRDDGPVYESPGVIAIWAKHGNLHRLGNPAILLANDGWIWCVDGKLHRVDGPAYQASSNNFRGSVQNYIDIDDKKTQHLHREWHLNGKRHRLGGPAVQCNICPDQYWVDDQRHRLDGPAVIFKSVRNHYYVNGKAVPPGALREKRVRDDRDLPEITISYFGNELVQSSEAKPTQRRKVYIADEPTEEEATAK